MTTDAKSTHTTSTSIGRHTSRPAGRSRRTKSLFLCVRIFCATVLATMLATPAFSAIDSSSTEQRITSQKAKAQRQPKDPMAWILLGDLYIRRAFETGDPRMYSSADEALAKASSLTRNSAELLTSRSSLALARHEFPAARQSAIAALKINPTSFQARLNAIDASIELGQYAEAEERVQELLEQRVGVASLSRLSYLRQLRGDLTGAEAAMRSAVASAPDGSIDRSVALGYLGEILLERGRELPARRAFEAAAAINPSSVVSAIGLASLAAGSQDYNAAVKILNTLTERVPTPGAFGLQADIARAAGKRNDEQAANQLVDATVALFKANGAVLDSELAILLADRGKSAAPAALEVAKRAYGERRTIFTADALAWASFQSGKIDDAVKYAKEATSTKPAVAVVRWHAAAIFAAHGDRALAKTELAAALKNRWFSPAQQPNVAALRRSMETK